MNQNRDEAVDIELVLEAKIVELFTILSKLANKDFFTCSDLAIASTTKSTECKSSKRDEHRRRLTTSSFFPERVSLGRGGVDDIV